MNEGQVDLSRLAIDRTPDSQTASNAATVFRRRKWLTRYLVPGAILAGFGLLVVVAAGNSLWPKPQVEVVPIIVKRGVVQQTGQPLFQAPGWIEPRPQAINIPALAPGVIEELLVVEGQMVKQGDPIARLISIDSEIIVRESEAALAVAGGELNRALAEQRAARVRLEKPVHLEVQLADAKSLLAKTRTQWTNLPFQIEAAEASVKYAEKSLLGKRSAGDAVPGVVLKKAESELAGAQARLRELKQRGPSLERELEAARDKVAAHESQLQLLVEERRQLEEAEAKVESAKAFRDAAKLRLEKARLQFERNTIRAPLDGRILRLNVIPGMRVMGSAIHAGQDSSSVVEMYDPGRLQVRADVRLEDVALVRPGQSVEIETASAAGKILGRVLQKNSAANIQKNTLEVKVELLEPPLTVRPEMLVTTTFLAPKLQESVKVVQQSQRLMVPQQLCIAGERGPEIWIVDADGRARKRTIETGVSTGDELVEVTAGLQLTDKLIASDTKNLSDGQPVIVTGDHRTIGR